MVRQQQNKAMKSLMELSARAVLASGIDDLDEHGNKITDFGRCACDYLDFLTDRTTQAFISALPLPETVKVYMNEVAKMICEQHEKEDDYDDYDLDGYDPWDYDPPSDPYSEYDID